MSLKPWMSSRDLIESVKRKIAIPINQRTFTDEDILAFASEELMISQVPDIMQYHEEYFVFIEDVPLSPNKTRYAVPERALGQKLRDIFYKDTSNNLFEMTRINPDDKSYWQRESSSANSYQKYWLEGSEVVLSTNNMTNPSGSLQFSYFLRPNQLVLNERAAIAQYFFKEITIDNTSLTAGDTLTIGDLTFTAVAGAPSALEFQIGATSILSASNLATAINTDGTYEANNGSPASTILTVLFTTLDTEIETSNTASFSISNNIGIQFTSDLPDNIVDGINIDFLQTKPGHRTYKLSVPLPAGSVSDNSIVFEAGVIPESFIIGDYICEEYECIIPQIPSDLHNGLAERVCGRILSAQGDMQGLQMTGAKLQDIQRTEGILLENRVDGSTQKIGQRKSLLSFLRMGVRRRF
jgi:hypothetical protein